MCCAFALLAFLGPRALIFFWWLADPTRWSVTFNNQVLVPILGFVFLPWTTVMYVIFWGPTGLQPLGWIFVGLGLLLDIGSYGGGAFNRDRMQGYYRQP
jgi:hypothetical protein